MKNRSELLRSITLELGGMNYKGLLLVWAFICGVKHREKDDR